MKQFIKYTHILSVLLVVSFVLIGCGAIEKDKPEVKFDPFYDDPNYYMAGEGIAGGDFSFADLVTVEAYIRDKNTGEFVEIEDGVYLPPGTYRLGIKPGNRKKTNVMEMEVSSLEDLLIGEEPMAQRVYASDGGTDYLVEAFLNDQSGLYECDFIVDGTYTTYTLLIEVIYPDTMAKKEKIIIATQDGLRASSEQLVKEGVGIAVNPDFLKDAVVTMLPDIMDLLSQPDITVPFAEFVFDFLCWDDDRPVIIDFLKDEEKMAKLSERVINKLGPKIANWVVTTGNGETTAFEIKGPRDAFSISGNLPDTFEHGDELQGGIDLDGQISINNRAIGNRIDPLVDIFFNKAGNPFIPIFETPPSINMDVIIQPILDQVMAIVLSVLDYDNAFLRSCLAGMLNGVFPMDITGYLHFFFRPEENTDNKTILFLTGYAADTTTLLTHEQLALDGQCLPKWPDGVTMDATPALDLTPIKRDDTDIGIAMSQYFLNSNLLGSLGDLLKINMPPEFALLVYSVIKPNSSASAEQSMEVNLNRNGLTIQFLESEDKFEAIVIVHEIEMLFSDAGAPVSHWNFDIGLTIAVGFSVDGEGNLWLNLKAGIIPEMFKLHIIDDTTGMGVLDKTGLMEAFFKLLLFEEMGAEGLEREFPINLTEIIGIKAKNEGLGVSSTQDGNCYLNMALDDEEPLNLNAIKPFLGECFISTVQF